MSKLEEFKKHLRVGSVYRRADLEQWTTSVDRHLKASVDDGTLQKVSSGLYYCPKKSTFGTLPPDDTDLIKTFLKDDYFLLSTPNDYNKLGVGTTQLYNKRVVYNHKRHGEFMLGGKLFSFHKKPRFPKHSTVEFLLVDMINNLNSLAEDKEVILKNVLVKAIELDQKRLKRSVKEYGTVKAKKILSPLLFNATA
ncbi:MAG: hypothetical protein GC193_08800 [Cryomorphaceae bacterium]|nr:hypothetical protein [Cryomorphaceae bacterium]